MSFFPERFILSSEIGLNLTGSSFSNFALNTSSRKCGVCFKAKEPGVISEVAIRLAARGYASFNPEYKVSLQGVGTDAYPDGTIKGGGSPCSKTFTITSSGQVSVTLWYTLDNSYTCTRGEHLSIVVEPTGSPSNPDGSNYITMSNAAGSSAGNRDGSAKQYDAAAWSVASTNAAVFGYKVNGVRHGFLASECDYTNFNANTVIGSGGDERGIVFTVPTWFCSTYAIRGVNITWSGAAGTTTVVTLYDGANDEVLEQLTFDHDIHTGGAPHLIFQAPYKLLHAGKPYRLTVAPQTASNLSLYYVGVTEEDDWESFAGVWFRSCYRADGGAWTEHNTRRYLISPYIHVIDKPVASRTRPAKLEAV